MCAIIAILAAVAMPVARLGIRRQKEIELRYKLRRITEAIDRYHDLRMLPDGQPYSIKDPRSYGAGDYPKKLEDLTKPVELMNGRKVRFLRERDLVDPMTGKNEWVTLSDSDDPDTTSSNDSNVYEVHSRSGAKALDGKTRYNEW